MAAPEAPVRLIDGATQVLTVPNAGNVTSAAVGSQTYAVRLSVITGNCLVRITHAGTAATVSQGALIKTTDIGAIFACAPGDKVSAFGLAAGTLYLDELTH